MMTRNEDFERMMRIAPRVRLGEVIEQRREKNMGYDVPIRGVTRDGFIEPKQKEADTRLYNVFYKYDFVFNPARMEINSIALNTEFDKAICSSLYEIFYVKDTGVLNPKYLNLFVKRDEFARQCEYIGFGSAREYCRFYNLVDIVIPLPSIEVQRELVAVYDSLRQTAEQNEAMLKPLADACHAYIVDCKEKYPAVKLGEYIEETDERNKNGIYTVKDVRGISIQKTIIPTKADMEGVSLKSYKVLNPQDFCVVTVTSRNGGKISLAINRDDKPYIFSSSYLTFKVKDNAVLNPEYLYLIFAREEFDRYSRYNSWGSARETFDWSEMERVQIPLPPIEVQQSIVSLYRCAEEAKTIAQEARELMRTICPALIQRATQGVNGPFTGSKQAVY